VVRVVSPPPSRLLVSDSDSSVHWYISTLRTRRTPSVFMPNSASNTGPEAVSAPITCTSLPSLAGSGLSAATVRTMPAPSLSDCATFTAWPSFQNSSTQATITSRTPNTMPTRDFPSRPSHELLSSTVTDSPSRALSSSLTFDICPLLSSPVIRGRWRGNPQRRGKAARLVLPPPQSSPV